MRISGRSYFQKAVMSYDDKPRKLWIFDFPAQTALCGVQISWTNDTNEAFSHLETGYKNALKEFNKHQVKNEFGILLNVKKKQIVTLYLFLDNAIERTYRSIVRGLDQRRPSKSEHYLYDRRALPGRGVENDYTES